MSCVHSFMSFESPEEISAKLTEPNVTVMMIKMMRKMCSSSVLGVHPLQSAL